MQGCIHFDFDGNLGGCKGLLQLIFGIRLTLIVVRRDPKIDSCLDLRREQVRAIGFIGHQASAVERCARTNAIGQGRTHQEGCKVAPRDVSGMLVVGRLVSLIVCHGFSSNEFIAFGYHTASSNVWVVELLDSGPLFDRDAIASPEGGSSTMSSVIAKI